MTLRFTASVLASLLAAAVASPATAQDTGTLDKQTADKVFPSKPPYSPYAGRSFPTMPLFGDTHLHTAFSMDAGAFGCRLTPSDAYRFARGEEVTFRVRPAGQAFPPARLSRRGRSLGRHWVLSAVDGRRSGTAGDTAGTEVV